MKEISENVTKNNRKSKKIVTKTPRHLPNFSIVRFWLAKKFFRLLQEIDFLK